MFKRNLLAFGLILTLILPYAQPAAASSSPAVTGRAQTVGGRSANVVTVDLNSPFIELDVIISNDAIGGDEPFTDMIARYDMAAAINANFFDAYTTLEPYGSIMRNGRMLYMEGTSSSMLFDAGNQVHFDRFNSVLKGYLNGKRSNEWNNQTQSMDFYLFDVWYVNALPQDPTGAYLFTPDRGASVTLEGGTVIEVINDRINRVTYSATSAAIPRNGYLIYYSSQAVDRAYIDARFKVGRTIAFEIETRAPKAVTTSPEAAPALPQPEPVKLYGSLNRKLQNEWNNRTQAMDFYLFTLWYVNAPVNDPTGVYLYTPERGKEWQVPGGHAATIRNGAVAGVEYDVTSFPIPADGYVIYFAPQVSEDTPTYVRERFIPGRTVDFYDPATGRFQTADLIRDAVTKTQAYLQQASPSGPSTQPVDLSRYTGMISAGPTLLRDGKIVADAAEEGFVEEKITTNRAMRSAIGLTASNQLLMVTMPNVTMTELAESMRQLGAVNAINLDGGGSSALYANGQVLTTPGRKLSTVLAVYDRREQYAAQVQGRRAASMAEAQRMSKQWLAYTSLQFKDVAYSDWYAEPVSRLVALGILGGYSDGTIRPMDDIEVDAFIKMTVTALGHVLPNGQGYWAQPFIDKAVELGLLQPGEFDRYDRPITRGEMARLIARAASKETVAPDQLEKAKSQIKDYNGIPSADREHVLRAFSLGIVGGFGDGTFQASQNANRAAAAVMITRLLDPASRLQR